MRTLLPACIALALLFSAGGAVAEDKPQPLSDEDFAAEIQKYLVADRYDGDARNRMVAEGTRRGKDAYRNALESEVRKAAGNANARQRYLTEADELGASDLYWKTALAEIRDAKTVYLAGSYLEHLERYLKENSGAHKDQLGDLSAALWTRAEKAGDGVCQSIFDYLARGEPSKVRSFIEQKLVGQLPDRDRAYYLEIYARIACIPEQERLALFKKELSATESTYVASVLRGCLEPLLGEEEAYRLARPKLQIKRFRGMTQIELRQAKVSFEFIDTPLSETITFLNSLVRNSGAKIEVSDTAPRDAAINLRVTDMKLGMALEWLAKLADCHLVKSGGTVTVKRK